MKSQPLNYLFTKEKLFVIDEYLKKKYPNITHQPAIDFEKKIPIKWREAVKEYIDGLKMIIQD